MDKLCDGDDGTCTEEVEADGYCDEHHPLAHLFDEPTPASKEPPMTATAEMKLALYEARGAWAIIRKGMRDKPPRVRRFYGKANVMSDETTARAARSRLDVRQGWAVLVDPDGKTIDSQSGPFGVRTCW